MAGLPGIIVKITADVKDAVDGINRVERAVGEPMGAFDRFGKVAIAAGAAIAGAFTLDKTITFLKDAATAAMEDERSMVALAKAMENVGVASQNASVESFVRELMLMQGIADDALRPALQRLITVTGDVTTSQNALKLALDISAGSGRDLDSVTTALAKAYGGQTTALGRLGVGLDAALLKSKDMDAITAALAEKFQGQAAAAAETYQGKLKRVQIAAAEAQETIGYALLQALDKTAQALGGTDGLVSLITRLGDRVAHVTSGLGILVDKLSLLRLEIVRSNTPADTLIGGINKLNGGLMRLFNPALLAVEKLEDMGIAADEAANRTRILREAMRDVTNGVPRFIAAMGGAQAGVQRFLQSADAAGFDVAAFYGVNPSGQQAYAAARANVDQIVADYEKAKDKALEAGGAGSAAAETIAIKWKQSSAEINAAVDGLSINIQGKMAEVSGKVGDAFKERFEAFKSIVGEQGRIIQQAQQALDSYARSVTDTIMGKLNFQTTMTDAEGKTVPMTPEQIVAAIFGDIANQTTAVDKMAGIINFLPEGLAQKLLALPTTFQIQLADYLAAHPDLLARLTEKYNELAKFTQEKLGIPMAQTFAAIGGVSAVQMIQNAKEQISKSASAFRNFVRSQLETTVRIAVVYDYPGGAPGPQPRAEGGPVVAGRPYVVGEVGPELFVPGRSGTIVPNSGMGGNTYNISVSTGVGDPRMIGEQIVSYVKRFEQASGAVWAAA